MELSELRQALKVGSGRYDLGDADLDRFLNAGQRYLDSWVGGPHQVARHFQLIQRGAVGVTFSATCRVIREVWIADTDSRTCLERGGRRELREAYAKLPQDMDAGRPLYWMPATLRTAPDQLTVKELQGFMGYLDVLVGTDYGHNGVIFYPPADKQYQVEVWGKFYTADLNDANPASYWSVNHPRLLLMAARREMEVDLRNTEGVNDFDRAMAPYLKSIEEDIAEQEAVDVRSMEG